MSVATRGFSSACCFWAALLDTQLEMAKTRSTTATMPSTSAAIMRASGPTERFPRPALAKPMLRLRSS